MADKEPAGLHWNPLVGLMWKTVPIGLIVSLTLLALAQIYFYFIQE